MPLIVSRYLASHLLSLLGNGIAAVALPLIVLQSTGSPLGMSALAASSAVPSLLVGLLGGVVIDRINRRTASVVSDVISAASIAALPLVDMVWGLNLGWFILLGIIGAFGDVPGMTAREVLAPMVARHAGTDLARLVGLRQTATSLALVLGPAAAGVLLAALDASSVLWITAATSAAAALLTWTLPRRLGEVGTGAPRRPVLRELSEGVGVVLRSRFLLGTSGLVVGLGVAVGGLQGLVMPLYFDLIERPDLLGLVLTALAAGMLCGAALYSAAGRRLPTRAWLWAGFTATTAGFLLMASLLTPAAVFAGAAALGLGNSVVGAVVGVLQVERTPSEVRGRVFSVRTSLVTIAAPVGIGLAGVAAEYGSAALAGYSVTAVWVLVLAAVLVSRALGAPAPGAAPGPEERSDPAAGEAVP